MNDITTEAVEAKVIEIVAEMALMKPHEVTLKSTLQELGVDSIAVMECIFAIEEAFDVHVDFNANKPEASAFDISSVGSIVTAVQELIEKTIRAKG